MPRIVSALVSCLPSTAAIVAALAILTGVPAAAVTADRTWSVAVHIRYVDGTVYDHAFATGVTTDELVSTLQACARAHAWGSAVTYHCYPIPE